jgi:ubiquinone/menaquinone biosynthesis C-methylase UbiE
MKIDFSRELEWWDAKAHKEEADLADEAINRALRWREIERHLGGVQTVLCIGGGTGAFSIPLARRSLKVIHVDFSPRMLELAQKQARGVETIRFVRANATDLSQFADCEFDLVLNMDGAISFSGSEAPRAISETCRVARQKLILTVTSRALMVPVLSSVALRVTGKFMDAVYEMLEHGEWHQEQFADNAVLSQGMTQDYCGAIKAFLPRELKALLEEAGMKVLRCGGLGSLAMLCGPETVQLALGDRDLFDRFVELCERFDADIMPDGPGTRQRAGLIAVAARTER